MRSIAIVALLALLIMPCIAVPDSVTTGPYKISFDLGQEHNYYNITLSDPEENEALSGTKFTNYEVLVSRNLSSWLESGWKLSFDSFSILIQRYTQEMGETSSDRMEQFLKESVESKGDLFTEGITNIQSSTRMIDNYEGAIVSYGIKQKPYGKREFPPEEAYSAMYQPIFRDSLVFIDAFSPWEEGTLQLLKTIHVEKINTTT